MSGTVGKFHNFFSRRETTLNWKATGKAMKAVSKITVPHLWSLITQNKDMYYVYGTYNDNFRNIIQLVQFMTKPHILSPIFCILHRIDLVIVLVSFLVELEYYVRVTFVC